MTIDNSANFSESGFQSNNLIAQMAELEVCCYSDIQGVNTFIFDDYFSVNLQYIIGWTTRLAGKGEG